jgi:hypothetical protein
MYALNLSLLLLLVRVLKHLSLQPVEDISIPPLLYLHPPICLLTRTHNLNTIVSGGFYSNVQMLYRRMPPSTTLYAERIKDIKSSVRLSSTSIASFTDYASLS